MMKIVFFFQKKKKKKRVNYYCERDLDELMSTANQALYFQFLFFFLKKRKTNKKRNINSNVQLIQNKKSTIVSQRQEL